MSQAEKRYRLLVEASPVCIHEIGLDGKILSMNPAGLSMLDLECEADIVGVPYLDAVCERHHASIATLLERALAGEASKFEFEGANGHRFTSAFVPIYADDGELVRLMGISQDVTQERELEAQLRQTQRLDSIGQLAGGIAHDFNNLLLVILGELHLADRDVQRGKSPASSLKAIRTAAERAANLTERLLALGRREPLDLVPTDINRLLAEHARIIARMLPETIAVTFTGAPALPAVNLDPAQMEEVLLNLSLNASQAMPGGGALQISTELVATVDEREPARVGVTVTDTGTGMAPDVADRAFDPFFTTKPNGAGTGLGLPIVYGIVSKHGGAVTLNSRPGRGTRVTIELPTTDEPVVPQTTPGNPGPASRAPGAVVLVVEDSDMVRDLVARTLREEGHTVLTAEDGQRAVEVLEQHPEIQLAILDVVMPKLTGPQVCDIIHARYPRVKVLFTSGYSAETLPPRYLENHGVYLLRKPYPPDQLVATVRRVLDE